MSTPTKNQITVKIFIGFQLSIDLKIRLNQNSEWKQAEVVKNDQLTVIRYENAEYAGKYLDHPMQTIKEIKVQGEQIRKKMKDYLPDIDVEGLKVNVFPQVFVS